MIAEKRRARRFPSRISIVSSDDEGLNFGFITDISRDGAYLEMGKLLPEGTPFTFVISNGSMSVPVTSKVVRNRDAFFHGGRSGAGVRFEQLDPVAKAVRDDLLLFLMNVRFQEVWEAA